VRLHNAFIANEEMKWPKEEERRMDEKESEEVWYHESNQALRQVRFWIAEYSLPRARDRLKAARIAKARPDPERASATQDLYQTLRVQMYTCRHVYFVCVYRHIRLSYYCCCYALLINTLSSVLQTFCNYSSQVGDDRPISVCQFSPNSKLLATASW
jgi:U4/U6 small nuclear ribonucleoprotein PRP4